MSLEKRGKTLGSALGKLGLGPIFDFPAEVLIMLDNLGRCLMFFAVFCTLLPLSVVFRQQPEADAAQRSKGGARDLLLLVSRLRSEITCNTS